MKNRTKIVATIGPATANPESLRTLKQAGMSVARLNGSHANLDWHRDTISLIRKTLPEVPILLDIPGRKIRTIQLVVEPSFGAGEVIILTTEQGHDGSRKVPVNYDRLHEDVKVGNTILADDGTLRFTVVKMEGRDIHCRAETAGKLKSRKGINVPFVTLKTELVTDRDRKMIAFCRETGVDFVGISFVESSRHVEAIRELIAGPFPQIVAKVENQGGLDHLGEVVGAADAIMIDRGDLSVETNLTRVALYQKRILECARTQGKPVIVATEMLHSMILSSQPTKAEITDITNAVLDGCAATMLSGETAVGSYPREAVEMMSTISREAEAHQLAGEAEVAGEEGEVPEVFGDAIAMICQSLPVSKIVAITLSGYAARMIAARRPRQPILAVSNIPEAARCFNLYYGTEGVCVDVPFSKNSTDHIVRCIEALWRLGKLADDDLILVTGVGYPKSGNRMNIIETHRVGDLAAALRWNCTVETFLNL